MIMVSIVTETIMTIVMKMMTNIITKIMNR